MLDKFLRQVAGMYQEETGIKVRAGRASPMWCSSCAGVHLSCQPSTRRAQQRIAGIQAPLAHLLPCPCC